MKFITRLLVTDHRRPGGLLQGPKAEPGTSGPRSPSASLWGSVTCLLIFLQFPKKPNAAGSGAQVSDSEPHPLCSLPVCHTGPCDTPQGCHRASPNTQGFIQTRKDGDHLENPFITSLSFICQCLCKRGIWERGSAVFFFLIPWSQDRKDLTKTNDKTGRTTLQGILCYCWL